MNVSMADLLLSISICDDCCAWIVTWARFSSVPFVNIYANVSLANLLLSISRRDDCFAWIVTWARFSNVPYVLSHHSLWDYVLPTMLILLN